MVSKYIDNKELKRVIEDGKLKPFKIKKVLRDQGIILTTSNSEQIAEQIYPILWGCSDIERLSQSIDDGGNYIKSSILKLKVDSSDNIMNNLEDFFDNAVFGASRYNLVELKRVNDDQIALKLEYSIIKPGRIEFISNQKKVTDIIVTKKEDNEALFDVRQASSSEMKEINRFLEKATNKDHSVVSAHITLKNLTNENRVAFFDEFVKMKFRGWRFVTVTKIELKKYEDDETAELSDEEDSAIANLQGITSAILNGTSIRNNSFVQECLRNNFYVTTMGYRFENLDEFIEVVIEINFKYDDLKIDICKTYEYDNDVEDVRLHPIMYSTQEKILGMFQDAAYRKYNEILNRQLTEIETS